MDRDRPIGLSREQAAIAKTEGVISRKTDLVTAVNGVADVNKLIGAALEKNPSAELATDALRREQREAIMRLADAITSTPGGVDNLLRGGLDGLVKRQPGQ